MKPKSERNLVFCDIRIFLFRQRSSTGKMRMELHWSSSAGRNLGIGKCCCKVLTGLLVTWMSCNLRMHLARGATLAKQKDPLLLGERNT